MRSDSSRRRPVSSTHDSTSLRRSRRPPARRPERRSWSRRRRSHTPGSWRVAASRRRRRNAGRRARSGIGGSRGWLPALSDRSTAGCIATDRARRREDETVAGLRVVERLDPEVIAHQVEPPPLDIGECEGEHADQPGEEAGAVELVAERNDFRVGPGLEAARRAPRGRPGARRSCRSRRCRPSPAGLRPSASAGRRLRDR